ncbi:MAG TPA: MobA/MobL family protein, partial [Sphingomonas sp.]
MRQRKDDAAHAIRARRERTFWRALDIADHKARMAFLREQAELDRAIADFWRRMRRKLPGQRHEIQQPNRQARRTIHSRIAAIGSRALPAYSGVVLDRKGRRGVYVAVRYLSAKTARHGCARRLVYYVVHPDHIERGDDGEPLVVSNVGETATEMASAFDLVEDLNRAARANAKIVFHFIIQLPHDVTPEERMRIVRTWCELEFGARDLPYVAALHEPSPEGDQRNCHAHVAVSFRPLVRVEPFTWEAGRELKCEIDNAQAFRGMREDFATVMTAVSQLAGHDRIYTGLSNAARGMKLKPTEDLGAHKTRQARNGHYVAAVERNRARIARNEALIELDRLKQRRETLDRRRNAVRATGRRTLPSVRRSRRPDATAVSYALPPIAKAVRPKQQRMAPATIVTPAQSPRASAAPTSLVVPHLRAAHRPSASAPDITMPVRLLRSRPAFPVERIGMPQAAEAVADAASTILAPKPVSRPGVNVGDRVVVPAMVRIPGPSALPPIAKTDIACPNAVDRPGPSVPGIMTPFRSNRTTGSGPSGKVKAPHTSSRGVVTINWPIDLPETAHIPTTGDRGFSLRVLARAARPTAPVVHVPDAALLETTFSASADGRRRRAKAALAKRIAAEAASRDARIVHHDAPVAHEKVSMVKPRSLLARVADIDWAEVTGD